MTDTDPMPYGHDRYPGPAYQHAGPGYQSPGPEYQPQPDYQPSGHGRARRPRDGSGVQRTALIVHTIADIAAAFLVLWIVLYMFDANQGNVFVQFVKSVADWLAGWSQDIFTMDTEQLRVLLNFGLPAVIYLAAGHGIAARVRHL